MELHNRVNVIVLNTDAMTSDALETKVCMLSSEERQSANELKTASLKLDYLAAHILKRESISALLDIPPDTLRFEYTDLGKPKIISPPLAKGVHFSISHTNGSVGCAISASYPVGFDIEKTDRNLLTLDLQEVFSREEIEYLSTAGNPNTELLRFWTLKEAYSKYRELGLNLNFSGINIRSQPREDISVCGLSYHLFHCNIMMSVCSDLANPAEVSIFEVDPDLGFELRETRTFLPSIAYISCAADL